MPKQDDIEIISPARPEKTVSIYSDGSMVIADAALVLGVTPQGIRTWLDQGAPLHHKGTAGRGNGMRVIVKDILEWREGMIAGIADVPRTGQYDEKAERARERHHIANMRQREDEIQAGRIVYIEAVGSIVDLEHAKIRAGFQNLPSRVSTDLSVISDPQIIRERLRSEIADIMKELSSGEEVSEILVAAQLRGPQDEEDEDEDDGDE